MKRTIVLLAVMITGLAAWCQAPPKPSAPAGAAQKPKVSPLAEYAGDWISRFQGNIWLGLRLELRDEKLIGSLLHPHSLELNDNGELKSVSEEQVTEPLTDAVLNPDGLLLTLKDPDTQETDRYMMRLVPPARETAELKMIGMSVPPGMSKPKPWRLERSGVPAAKKAPDPR
jgi:hypothetical protein